MITAPYGAWPSPIRADDVTQAGLRLGFPRLVDGQVWWVEGRPTEKGRQTVARGSAGGSPVDLLAAPWNARTAVHEYGGLPYLPVPTPAGPALVFTHHADQRMYRLDPGETEPVALTPPPATPRGLRYAEPVLSPDGTEVWCVREAHADGQVRRHLLAVPLDGSQQVRPLVSGSDFLAWPRPSPDGRRLAWVAWNHPLMPWDGGELRVGDLGADGTVERWQTVLGGPTESLFQPEWADNDTLYVVSDRTGWWNLYRLALADSAAAEPEPLCPRPEEFGVPLWQVGSRTYTVLDDGRLAVLHGTDEWRLGLLDPASRTLTDLDLPYTVWAPTLHSHGSQVVAIAGGPLHPPTVVQVDTAAGTVHSVRQSTTTLPDAAYLPRPRAQVLPGRGGRQVHVHVYPPTNPDVSAPDGELPPYVVWVHGGPTAQALPALDMAKAFFTSRGIGVVDVNYGGSTGYGRQYRERLRGQWGIVDVEDVVAAARALVDSGQADGARLAIRGGSAGGWTVLSALTRTDTFAAGVSYYGVADLLTFAADTHDFESRYLDGLVGPLPEHHDRYVERSPLSHVDKLSCPVLLLQGADDPVVPPSQAEAFRDALARKGVPHAYLLFDGEQHGFTRADTQRTCLHAELSFYGQVFGFDPPDTPRLSLSTGGGDRNR